MKFTSYTDGLLTNISQTIHSLFGGHPDLSISSQAFINRNKPFWSEFCIMIDTIMFWEPDHCKKSFLTDVKFAEDIIELAKEVLKDEYEYRK
jgi:hypothetical protein